MADGVYNPSMNNLEKKVEGRIIPKAPRTGEPWRTISVPQSLYLNLERAAAQRELSLAYFVRKCLLEALKAH